MNGCVRYDRRGCARVCSARARRVRPCWGRARSCFRAPRRFLRGRTRASRSPRCSRGDGVSAVAELRRIRPRASWRAGRVCRRSRDRARTFGPAPPGRQRSSGGGAVRRHRRARRRACASIACRAGGACGKRCESWRGNSGIRRRRPSRARDGGTGGRCARARRARPRAAIRLPGDNRRSGDLRVRR